MNRLGTKAFSQAKRVGALLSEPGNEKQRTLRKFRQKLELTVTLKCIFLVII